MYVVVMESELGLDEFPRDTLEEAKETIRRLKAKAKELNDGIDREYRIEVRSDDETDSD